MLLTPTAEHESFRQAIREFLRAHSAESEVRRLMESERGYDPMVWRQLATQLGLQGMAIPEEFGGSGYGWPELGIALEEMGRVLLCAPFFATSVLASSTLLESGDLDACRRYLPEMAAGTLIATLAILEDSGSWRPQDVALSARQSADGWLLDGHKTFVLDAHVADLILTVGRTPAGLAVFAVDANAAGLTKRQLATADPTRRQGRVEFEGTPAELVDGGRNGWDVVQRVLDLAVTALAIEQVGGAQRAMEMSVEYASIRTQFGRSIGSFQAVKHKCADMLLEVETARSAASHALWSVSEAASELPVAARLAGAYCSEAFLRVATENIQVHGGIGFTWEHPAHLYFRRAKSSQLLFGHPNEHRELLAGRIGLSA